MPLASIGGAFSGFVLGSHFGKPTKLAGLTTGSLKGAAIGLLGGMAIDAITPRMSADSSLAGNIAAGAIGVSLASAIGTVGATGLYPGGVWAKALHYLDDVAIPKLTKQSPFALAAMNKVSRAHAALFTPDYEPLLVEAGMPKVLRKLSARKAVGKDVSLGVSTDFGVGKGGSGAGLGFYAGFGPYNLPGGFKRLEPYVGTPTVANAITSGQAPISQMTAGVLSDALWTDVQSGMAVTAGVGAGLGLGYSMLFGEGRKIPRYTHPGGMFAETGLGSNAPLNPIMSA